MSQPPEPGAVAPQGPPSVPPSHLPQGQMPQGRLPQGRLPQWPVLRKKQTFVVPIIAIVVGVLIMSLLIVTQLVFAPVQSIIGLVLSALAAIVGILLLVWLDRWEPEPPHLLIAAFFWGGGVSLLMVFVASPLLQIIGGDSDFFRAVISAPLIEESAKGLFLVLVLLVSRRGRAELNSFVDALVYAGFVGIGFTFIEDLSYIGWQETVDDALGVATVRIIFGAWLHSIFTVMTAVGLWLGLNSRGAMRFVFPVLGWCVAVLLHALHNGASFVGVGYYFLVILLIFLPVTIAVIVLAVRSHRREGESVRGQLPVMVHNGWITPEEAAWLGNLRSRRQALAYAKTQSRQERQRMAAFRDHVTELAFVRDRLDRHGPPFSPDLVRQHDELVRLLVMDKQWVAEHLQPPSPAWQPVGPVPGQDYVQPSFGPPGPPGPPPPMDPDATRLR